jgi:NAD+ synthetase
MKIGLLQLGAVVGDLSGNAGRIALAASRAARAGADLCVTSEMALTGYPPRDLLLAPAFIEKTVEELEGLAQTFADGPSLLIGAPMPSGRAGGKPLVNGAVLLSGGKIAAVWAKNLLPTYDVFDEARYFEPGGTLGVLELDGWRLGVTICEDIWNDKDFWSERRYPCDPMEALAAQGVHAVANLSASPFALGKQRVRQDMLSSLARKYALPMLYCNQTGGNDDLVFDGRSMAFDAGGTLAARAAGFEEDVLLLDLDALRAPAENDGGFWPLIAHDELSEESEAWRALVLGVRDYCAKCGFTGALLGLSGGIDSALTAAIAAEALGPENVLGVLMPSPYSSQGSIDDSLDLAARLGVRTLTIPIRNLMESFDQALAEAFKDHAPDVTEENIQSRIRGNLLMAMSNKFGQVLLSTGNKSELAVGYCTIYGDMSGGLAVIADVPKTLVYRLAEYVNASGPELIPQSILAKAPSAELRPEQTDQDSLPPYDVLDAILKLRVERYKSVEEIVAQGFDEAVVKKVCRLVKAAEFKRRQAAPGIKITDRAFGAGWRMPLACKVAY